MLFFSNHLAFAIPKALRTLALLSLSLLVMASSQAAHALEPYQATYSVALKAKISMRGTLKRSLTKTANGQWLFKDNVSALLASIEESSLFTLKNNRIAPQKYHYLRKIIGKKKKQDISFDWTKKQATNRDSKIIALKTNSQDPLSYQLQLQLDLQSGQRGNFSYPFIKNSKMEQLQFVEVGTEVIDTPLGKLRSIKLKLERGSQAKRETFIWFSIKHNFIITKLQQTEADGKSFAILLEKLS